MNRLTKTIYQVSANCNNMMDSYQAERTYLLAHFQYYRIVQPKVVFVHGLPELLSDSVTLKRQISKYGCVNKVNLQRVGKDFYSAFVQFQYEIDAAFLIVLDSYRLSNRTLRVFYGSTKFCPHYLKGHTCRLADCNYAHYYHPLLTHQRDQVKHINHHQIAKIHIMQHQNALPDKVNRVMSQVQREQDLLPLQKEQMLSYLMAQGYMAQHSQIEPPMDHCPLQITKEQSLYTSGVQTESGSIITSNMEGGQQQQQQREWDFIERQISLNRQCNKAIEENIALNSECQSKIQQFLDGAERFLTKLIFHSSEFVY